MSLPLMLALVFIAVVGLLWTVLSALIYWATEGTVPASSVTLESYAEARIEGMLRAYDCVKPSYEDPLHPVYAELYPASSKPIVPEQYRTTNLDALIDERRHQVETLEAMLDKHGRYQNRRRPRTYRQYDNGYIIQVERKSLEKDL